MPIRYRSFSVLRIFLPLCITLVLLFMASIQLSSNFSRSDLEYGPLFGAIYPTQQSVINPTLLSLINPKCPENRSGYCIIANYQSAQAIVGYEESVTLSTQGTVKFLHHLPEVCMRWLGPISVSVYAPGRDFPAAKHAIETLRTQNECTRKWVSWHLIFDAIHPPTSQELLVVGKLNTNNNVSSYIDRKRLPYPINVARNVARLNANTRYILASDIELYPSTKIIPMFLELIKQLENQLSEGFSRKKQVFVLPVLEVHEDAATPNTKAELVSLFVKRQAVSFHKFMCNTCHQIPKFIQWMRTNSSANPGKMTIFMTTKRQRSVKLSAWEPFYISTNDVPLFDERLTWNGKINKMQNAFELCLLDYDFHIIDGAFLTHAPGIKIFSYKEQAPRTSYMKLNKARYKTIENELHSKYGEHKEC